MSLLRRVLGPPDVKKHLERRDVARLVEDLRDRDASVRAAAAAALGELRDSSVVPRLIEAFDDPDKAVTDAITAAISAMGPEVIPLLAPLVAEGQTWARSDRGARAAITSIAHRQFDNSVPALRELLRHSEWRVRNVAREIFIAHGEHTVPHAVAALNDANPGSREAAAEILGVLRKPEAVEPLISALGDSDARVRHAVAVALGNIGDPRAADPLIELVRDNADPPRTAAVDAVGKLRVGRAVQPLVDSMEGASDSLLGHIAEAFRLIGDSEAAPPLRLALEKTKNLDTRGLVLSALASLQDPLAKPILLKELKLEENRLRARPHVDRDDFRHVTSVIGSLGLFAGDDIVNELRACLKSPLSYDVGDRDDSERFYPIRDAARSALELLGRGDAKERSARASETKTGRFQIGS